MLRMAPVLGSATRTMLLPTFARLGLARKLCLSSGGCLQSALPEFTSVRQPQLKRHGFEQLTQKHVDVFKSILPDEGQVLLDDIEGYNVDWLRTVRGKCPLVVRPRSTAQVSEIIKYCSTENLAVVPQGGNTGLVGGSVPVFDEIVLTTQLMNKVMSLDQTSGVLVCQAGCILENLDDYLSGYNMMMPLDLGAKGSCHIGGNVSTNAGGIRLLRYGSLHGSVLGIEAVLADGQVVDCLSSLRKDNTGYDLKQLFIGSEGTLGIVTAVSILCPQRPNDVNVAFLGCSSFEKVLALLKLARSQLGEILSAFEFFDEASARCNHANLGLSQPLPYHPFHVLIETSGSHGPHDEEKLYRFLDDSMAVGLTEDGTVATDMGKIKELWGLRERITEGLVHDGYCYKYDVSLPMSHFYKLVEETRERVEGVATRCVGYGHVGDGNLHLNVTGSTYSKELHDLLEPFIFDFVSEHRGSISAEHGLGLAKRNYIYHSRTPEQVTLMRNLKQMMDPKGILNPYKMFPS